MSVIDLKPLICLERTRMDVERGNCEYNVTDYLDTIEQALLELQSIKEANPSKALECLDKLEECAEAMKELPLSNWIDLAENEAELDLKIMDWVETIKFELFKGNQGLIKAQEHEKEIDRIENQCLDILSDNIKLKKEYEKENAYIEKIKAMMKQKDCVLRYIESEDCFAVKTILSDGWYRLTPELVESNVREEIKPLPLIEKNKQLKQENADYKRFIEIVISKNVNIKALKHYLKFESALKLYNSNVSNDEELTEEEWTFLKEMSKDVEN